MAPGEATSALCVSPCLEKGDMCPCLSAAGDTAVTCCHVLSNCRFTLTVLSAMRVHCVRTAIPLGLQTRPTKSILFLAHFRDGSFLLQILLSLPFSCPRTPKPPLSSENPEQGKALSVPLSVNLPDKDASRGGKTEEHMEEGKR